MGEQVKPRVLVSGEVLEELEEILALMEGAGYQILVSGPQPLLERLVVPDGMKIERAPAREAGYGNRAQKVLGLLQFLALVSRCKPDVLVSGYSMLKHRLASQLLSVPHIAYYRGLMFDASVRSGFSDSFETNPVSRLIPQRVRQPFGADQILTVSEINSRFLMARGIPAERVSLCGPIWLRGLQQAAAGESAGRIIICTSALAAHGHDSLHELQTETLARFVQEGAAGPRRVVLRVHPRDFYAYQDDPRFASVEIDSRKPSDFLQSLCREDVLVSPPSTLVHEAGALGVSSILYRVGEGLHSNESLAASGAEVFDLMEIDAQRIESARPFSSFAPIETSMFSRALDSLVPSDLTRDGAQ